MFNRKAVVVPVLVIGLVLASIGGAGNPFRATSPVQRVEAVVSTFGIERATVLTRDHLDALRVFFSSSVLAYIWDAAGEEGITAWEQISDLSRTNRTRLSVFFVLIGEGEGEGE